jgi:hypothetical protein
MTTEPPSPLRALMMTLVPIALGRYDKWIARRARARRNLERQRARLTAGANDTAPHEPRERIRTGPPREPWRQYADQLAAERRRMTFTNHRGMHEHR